MLDPVKDPPPSTPPLLEVAAREEKEETVALGEGEGFAVRVAQ